MNPKPATPRANGDVVKRHAVLYARVSSKDQEKEGYSIPAQQKLLRNYALSNHLTILQEFVDIETAKQAGRTAFGEMLAFLRKHRDTCRVLLVEKTDRLYRNFKDWVTLDEFDLDIHLVKENVILSPDSRSQEKFVHGIKVLMAKNYTDNLSEETRKGMLEKAEQGIWPSYTPIGYRNVVGPDGKKIIEPDPEMAPVITRVFEWYATGRYTLREVMRMARAAGLRFPRSRNTVTSTTIHHILHNRIYTGDFDWKGKTYRGIHEPLVSRELWERVQRVLEQRLAGRGRKAKHNFAFSRLIKCGHCGCLLVGQIQRGRYVYYHCSGYKGKCPEPFVREEVLEERFADLLKRLAFDEEVLNWVTEALRQNHDEEKRFHDEALGRLQAEYSKLQSRLDAMYVDKLDGRIDAAFYDRKAGEWQAEQTRLLRLMEEHQAANHSYLADGVRLLALARQAGKLFERQPASSKRRLLDFLLSNTMWKGGELRATFRQPFDLIAVTAEADRTETAAGGGHGGRLEKWLPGRNVKKRPDGERCTAVL
jgi:DNA invertase Pin-like site-specific DNA recombinase